MKIPQKIVDAANRYKAYSVKPYKSGSSLLKVSFLDNMNADKFYSELTHYGYRVSMDKIRLAYAGENVTVYVHL